MFLIASPADELVRHWQKGLGEAATRLQAADLAAVEQAMVRFNPAVLALDCDMPGLNGATGVSMLQKLSPTTQILAFTRAFDANEELALLRVGVVGCCRKDIDPDLLNRVVTVVLQGGLWVTRSLIPSLIDEIRLRHSGHVKDTPAKPSSLHVLTRREQEVAALIGNGASNKQIARALDISDRTVKSHLTAIFQKLGIADRLHLALYMNANLSTIAPPAGLEAGGKG